MTIKRILVVEDDKLLSTLSGMFIDELGYELAGRYQNGELMLQDLDTLSPDMVLMDVQIKGPYDGIETARYLLSRRNIPVVFITGDLPADGLEEIMRGDFYGYLQKPFTKAIFDEAIKLAGEKHQQETCNSTHEQNKYIAAIVRQDGFVRYANKAFMELFHIKNEEEAKCPVKDLLVNDMRTEFTKALEYCFINNVALKPFTFNITDAEGKLHTHHFQGSLLYFKNEKSLYLSVY